MSSFLAPTLANIFMLTFTGKDTFYLLYQIKNANISGGFFAF